MIWYATCLLTQHSRFCPFLKYVPSRHKHLNFAWYYIYITLIKTYWTVEIGGPVVEKCLCRVNRTASVTTLGTSVDVDSVYIIQDVCQRLVMLFRCFL